MGYAMRAPDAAELTAIRRYVAESMAGGAFGMSFGGIYPPSNYAATEELIEASKEVAAAGGIYACHMRNERERLLEAVEESIRIGRESGAAVQISHHKASSPKVWGMVTREPEADRGRQRRGLDVTVDQYPYRASSTNLNAMMPAWAHEGGLGELARAAGPSRAARPHPGRPPLGHPERDRRQPDPARHPGRLLPHRPLVGRQDDRRRSPRRAAPTRTRRFSTSCSPTSATSARSTSR